MKYLKLLLIVALVAGLIYGALRIMGPSSDTTKIDPETPHITEQPSDTGNHESIAQKIREFESQLHSESISFDDIKEMYSWLTDNDSKLDSINEGIQFKKRIEVYMKLISVIEDPKEICKMEKIRDIAKDKKSLIEDIHYKYLQRLWILDNNGVEQLAKGKQVNAVNKKLKNSAQTFKTFKDLPSCDNATDNVGTLTNQNQAQNKQSGVPQDPIGDTDWGD